MPPDQFVKDIGTELVKLDGRETDELVAGLIGLLLVIGVANGEKCAEGNVMFAENGLVEIGAYTVAATLAASVHVGSATRAGGDGGWRRRAAVAPGAGWEAVDAHVDVRAAGVRGRGKVWTRWKGAVVGRLVFGD